MHPPPDEPATAARMRAAHHHARTALHVQADEDGREIWGWRGRTLSAPVTAQVAPAWLRLAAVPCDQTDRTFWNGTRDARGGIPAAVPRPHLRQIYDWSEQDWDYRAELYDRISARTIAPSPMLTAEPDLPPTWWTDLHTALNTVAAVPTDRYTTDQPYLDRTMPTFLGADLDTHAPSWTTAHGDLHWANLTAPNLTLFDWEGWGLAPTGYDAAMLHSYSLLAPSTAARIRSEFAHILDTPAGRFAELTVLTELLESTTWGGNLPLAEPLHRRAAHLLDTSHRSDG